MKGRAERTKPPRTLPLLLVLSWLLLFGAVSVLIVQRELHRVEAVFIEAVDRLHENIERLMQDAEVLVQGFAAYVRYAPYASDAETRRYTKPLVSLHPGTFLEIVDRVPASAMPEYLAAQREALGVEFDVRSFDYLGDRNWQAVDSKTEYYPIRFIDPLPPDARSVLGLDISSVSFLGDTLRRARETGSVAATPPFTLVEGVVAFGLIAPIMGGEATSNPAHATWRPEFAELISPAERFRRMIAGYEEFSVSLRYVGPVRADATALISTESMTPARWLDRFLPTFDYQRGLSVPFEQYYLGVSYSTRVSDLNLPVLGGIGFAALVSLLGVLLYATLYHRRELERLRGQEHLFELANFDSLTALPNRNLLRDRLERALTRAKRTSGRAAVLFLDLDGFKAINDRHGHIAGDRVLTQAANRLKSVLRAEDTCARWGGDEFVIVIEGDSSDQAIGRVVEAINKVFEKPFGVGKEAFALGVSMGKAVYPDDGRTSDELLHRADTSMYEHKSGGVGARRLKVAE